MNKNLLTLAFMVLIASDSFGMGSRKPSTPIPTVPPIETPKPATPPVYSGIKFSPLTNHTAEEKEVVAIAEGLANDLIKSQCFLSFMENRELKDKKGRVFHKGLISTNGKTPKQVVDHLKGLSLTVPVEMYYTNNSTVGYRWTGDPKVFTNRKFHAGATACARGSNLTHEWSHVAGYGHTSKATSIRPATVPYSINGAFLSCCECKKNSVKSCSVKP